MILLYTDLNARIGEVQDQIQDVAEVSPRVVIDLAVNKHGEEMIDFLKEVKI